VISIRKTLELGVTGSHQNAAAGHRAMTPRSAIANEVGASPTVINMAGGAFCHADVRV
jgi:hypothetical protein